MSTVTAPPAAAPATEPPAAPDTASRTAPSTTTARRGTAFPATVTGTGIVRSEWIKLRSLRSTWWTLLGAVVAMMGLGALFSSFTRTGGGDQGPGGALDPAGTSLGGYNLAQLAVGVLGVLMVTGEYSTGTIRTSLAAVPKRVPVVLAKMAVLAMTLLTTMLVASFGAFFLGQWLLSRHGASTTIGAPGVLRVVIGTALYLTVIGLLGATLGWLLRRGAGALATLFGLLLVLPILGALLPKSWSDVFVPYLPSSLGRDLLAVQPVAGSLGPWTGFALLCGYVVVLAAAGAVLLRRRDV
jgi:ABC-2 type transport system permease protein